MSLIDNIVRAASDRARYLLWNLRVPTLEPRGLSFSVPDEWLRSIRVDWPSQYGGKSVGKWVDPYKEGLSSLVSVRETAISQPHTGITLFRINTPSALHTLALDYQDAPVIVESALDDVSIYFKMQYNPSHADSSRIRPGGFVPGDPQIYKYIKKLRRIRQTQPLSYEVYGRFGSDFQFDLRRRVTEKLDQDSRFDFEGGVNRISYIRYLEEVARSKVCIDLPGNGEFCFRLFDYLSIGSCVITWRQKNKLPVNPENGINIVSADESLDRMRELCLYFVRNDSAREQMANNASEYFDRYLHRRQLAAYFLRCCYESL